MKLYHDVRQISRVERELLELKRQKAVRTTKTLVLSRFYYRKTRVAQELPMNNFRNKHVKPLRNLFHIKHNNSDLRRIICGTDVY